MIQTQFIICHKQTNYQAKKEQEKGKKKNPNFELFSQSQKREIEKLGRKKINPNLDL